MKKDKIFSSFGILPKEEMLEVRPNFKQLQIGIPKESSFQENRVSLTPDSVGLLIANGHSVIIEKEAGNNKEKILIAGVFLKRITLGMKLQADPTIIYGLLPNFDGDIKKSDILNKNNLYNTYMIKGLPPTPISIDSPE